MWHGADSRGLVCSAIKEVQKVAPQECRTAHVARLLVGRVTRQTRKLKTIPSFGRLKGVMGLEEIENLVL